MSLSPQERLSTLIQFGRRVRIFAAKGPAYHYTYGRWRLDGWWRKRMAPFSDMDDASFFARLELKKQGLADVKKAVAEKDYESAKTRLVVYFRTRDEPRFHFSWKDREKITSVIEDEQKEATIHAADEICQDIFRFRRVAPVKFENGIDWTYCPRGNTDWTWDLNRHPYFITLGKAYWYTENKKYAEKFAELLFDWIDKNPAGVGQPNWDSVLEVAVRLNTWVWAFFFFRRADAFRQDGLITFLKGLLTHARYLAARIEHHAVNNHLLLEAKALASCGLLFPEFKEAKAWRDSGLRILWSEIEKQVCADGVHAERAPLYHRRVMSDLLEMLVLLENNDLPVPEHVIHRVEKMLDFDRNIAKPNGTIPLFSDSALTEIQARFSGRGGGATLFDRIKLDGTRLDEDMAWLLARKKPWQNNTTYGAPERKLVSRAFPEGGYFVMRGGAGKQGLYLAFDCGPFGYEPAPIHGHADALSFDLYAYGQSLITDCGVYSYHLGENWRNYFRGTSAHNTVVVDGKDQSILLGSRRVYHMARATLHQWVSNVHFDFVDGSHDGYCRLAKPVIHRRKIFFLKPEYWIVVDLLTGQPGQHRLEQYFHLMPWATLVLDQKTKTVRVEYNGTPVITIAPSSTSSLQAKVITGATNPRQGWVSFFSGEKIAAPGLVYRKDVQVPTSFTTVLYPHPAKSKTELRVSALKVTTSDGKPVDETVITGLRVETAEHVDTCIVAHDGAPSWKAFAGYESDGDLIYVRRRKGDGAISKIIKRGGRRLSFQGKSLLEARGLPQDFALNCAVMTGEK